MRRTPRKSMALMVVLGFIFIASMLMLNHQGNAITQQDRTVESVQLYFASKGLIQLARLKTQQPILYELNRATNYSIGIDPDYKLYRTFDGKYNQGPVFAFKNTDGKPDDQRTYADAAAISSANQGYQEPLRLFRSDLTLDSNSAVPQANSAFKLNVGGLQGQVTEISTSCKAMDPTTGDIVIVVTFKGWTQIGNVGVKKDQSYVNNFNYEEKVRQTIN